MSPARASARRFRFLGFSAVKKAARLGVNESGVSHQVHGQAVGLQAMIPGFKRRLASRRPERIRPAFFRDSLNLRFFFEVLNVITFFWRVFLTQLWQFKALQVASRSHVHSPLGVSLCCKA